MFALSSCDHLALGVCFAPTPHISNPHSPITLPTQDDAVWEFDSGELHLPSALRLLAAEVGGAGIQPGVNCRGAFCSPSRPQLPSGEGREGGGWGGQQWCDLNHALVRAAHHPHPLPAHPAPALSPPQAPSPPLGCARWWQRCSLRALSLWTSPSPGWWWWW